MHKDRLGQVIYVGKAISLRNRVRQYFQTSYQTNPKIRALVGSIAEFEYITCSSEMEALILECNLIKKYMPKYNVLLRDDKTYPYIVVTTSEEYPRVVKTRLLKKDGNRYFGPYSDAGAVNEIVDLFGSIYALKRCRKTSFPEGFRPCLHYFIGECQGMCIGEVDKARYRETIEEILQYLSGKARPLLDRLKDRMQKASEAMAYEEAAKWRDAIKALEALSETQRVTMIGKKDMDIVLPLRTTSGDQMVLFPVRDGKLSGRETFPIQAEESDQTEDLVAAFIKQYYSQWATVPREILVDRDLPEQELLEEFLSKEGHRVHIHMPQKGDKKALLDLTRQDVAEMTKSLAERAETRRERQQAVLREMNGLLSMVGCPRAPGQENSPVRVESYDISNTNGVDSVGAMVVFSGLNKVKKDYRRFRIRTIEGADDYGSLQEVLYRRYKHALAGDPGFSTLPDIIMMDGGLGQVHAAKKILDAMRLPIPVVGMAKDDAHRTRAIVFDDGRELPLADHQVLFSYAGTIQEEVHRYAIDYHHKLHGKNAIHSVLDEIPGVGPKRRNELLYHFKSVEGVKAATMEELMELPSVTRQVAENIREYFK